MEFITLFQLTNSPRIKWTPPSCSPLHAMRVSRMLADVITFLMNLMVANELNSLDHLLYHAKVLNNNLCLLNPAEPILILRLPKFLKQRSARRTNFWENVADAKAAQRRKPKKMAPRVTSSQTKKAQNLQPLLPIWKAQCISLDQTKEFPRKVVC